MTREHVATWVRAHPLSPTHVDCATTVMLKILDGKCKMNGEQKVVMAYLYDEVRDRPGDLFGEPFHELIARGRAAIDDELREEIYERRLLAETQLSRPVMKAFKAMLRQTGLIRTSQG